MARPRKAGLDYFPLDTQLDDKTRQLIARYGVQGYGILVRLWQKIYGEAGYFTAWNEGVISIFAHENGVLADGVRATVSICVELGLFDERILREYGVLTSVGIQKRYAAILQKRVRREINPAYLLISLPSEMVSDAKTEVSDAKTEVSDGHNPQSKVNERKEKQRKVKVDALARATPLHTPNEDMIVQRGEVTLARSGYDELASAYGLGAVDSKIERMNEWLHEHPGHRIKDYFAKLRAWLAEDTQASARPGPSVHRPGKTVSAQRVPQREYGDDEYRAMYADLGSVLSEYDGKETK
ncbi:MAG: DUF4373 domain-containing protein [Christensenellaceae bacterium]|nr:DUF4373 domain-containing protein [Christensenellaceae bacterium]